MRNHLSADPLATPRRREDRERIVADMREGFARMPRAAGPLPQPARQLFADVKRGRRKAEEWLLDLFDALISAGAALEDVEAPIRRLLAAVRGRYRRLHEPTLSEVMMREAEAEGIANAATTAYALMPSESNREAAARAIAAHLSALEVLYETVTTPRLCRRCA